MQKTTVTVDLTKIDKSRIEERTYTNREGAQVTVKEYKMDIVPLKQPRVLQRKDGTVIEGDTWRLEETHFACESKTKEEREANKPTVYIGKGTQLVDKNPSEANSTPVAGGQTTPDYPADDIDPEDVPF